MTESYTDKTISPALTLAPDVVILGGGCAGLWILDRLVTAGYDAYLLERSALCAGQTIWSQGILHSGLKYTLSGAMNSAAKAIQHMPARWMDSIQGNSVPDLSGTMLRASHCHLWRTKSLSSRAGMIGARVGLRTKPKSLAMQDRPPILQQTPGTVALLDEPVIDPQSFASAMRSVYPARIAHAPSLSVSGNADAPRISADGKSLQPKCLVIAAGNGSAQVRTSLGLPNAAMQVRPLRMVVVQSNDLPPLNGHCVDGNATRLTITTQLGSESTPTAWQLGGNIAEIGPSLSPSDLLREARKELIACVPHVDASGILHNARWMVYDAPRAEGATPSGKRPEHATVIREGRTVTAWPSKLVLAPQAASQALESVREIVRNPQAPLEPSIRMKAAPIAAFPWQDTTVTWTSDSALRNAQSDYG